jgi:hypothetical protein
VVVVEVIIIVVIVVVVGYYDGFSGYYINNWVFMMVLVIMI